VPAAAGDRVLELAHARPELATEARQPLGPEDEEDDDEHDDELGRPDALEDGQVHGLIPFEAWSEG
jgi:hypothetical protein